MGKDERNPISRIKVANLPKTKPCEAKQLGPLGLLRLETCPEDGKTLYIGNMAVFEMPNVATAFPLVVA